MWSWPSAIPKSAPPSSATCVSASEGRDVPRGRRVLLRDRARPRPPRDPDRRPPWLGGKAPYLALGQPSRPALVWEAHHGIPPLLGDVDPLVRPRASALWRLLGARGRSPRDVLPPHRHLGLSLVRVQSPLRRPPVPQGTDLVVPHLDLGRSPPLPARDRVLPVRRARPRALDGGVALACRAMGHGLRRGARSDGRRDRRDPSPPAPASGSRSSGRGEGQAQVTPARARAPSLRQVEPAPKLADGPLVAGARRLVLVAEHDPVRPR